MVSWQNFSVVHLLLSPFVKSKIFLCFGNYTYNFFLKPFINGCLLQYKRRKKIEKNWTFLLNY